MDTIVLSFVVAVAVIAVAYIYLSRTATVPSSSISIQGTIADGKKSINSRAAIPMSLNQPAGIAFSYTCWVLIDDFAYKYGSQKVIFTKGSEDLSSACPALLLDGTTNTMLLKMDTFGGQEVVPISNIPAKKWLHVAIAVDQDSVDVYINGVLHTHHTLGQLPKQNNGTVHVGIDGGFDGKIAGLQYYSYLLTPDQVSSAMGTAPQSDPSTGPAPLPPYFDTTWWTGRT
jgi:hypothetical protein